jgi:hypothetical protein
MSAAFGFTAAGQDYDRNDAAELTTDTTPNPAPLPDDDLEDSELDRETQV